MYWIVSTGSLQTINKVPIGGGTIAPIASIGNFNGVFISVLDSSGNLFTVGDSVNAPGPGQHPSVLGVNVVTSHVGLLYADTSFTFEDTAGIALAANDVLYFSNYQFSPGTGAIYSIPTTIGAISPSSSMTLAPQVIHKSFASSDGTSMLSGDVHLEAGVTAPLTGAAVLDADVTVLAEGTAVLLAASNLEATTSEVSDALLAASSDLSASALVFSAATWQTTGVADLEGLAKVVKVADAGLAAVSSVVATAVVNTAGIRMTGQAGIFVQNSLVTVLSVFRTPSQGTTSGTELPRPLPQPIPPTYTIVAPGPQNTRRRGIPNRG